MSRAHLLAPVVATVALTVVGCGGSSKSTASTTTTTASVSSTEATTPVTAQQLIAKANAACAAVHAKFAAYRVTTLPALGEVAPRIATYEAKVVSELKKLAPPSSPASLKSDWEVIVHGLNTLAVNTARVGVYARQNDLTGAHPLIVQTNNARLQILAVAKHSGFTGCKIITR